MALWGIFLSAFFIGFSGAMMPGPLLGVAIDGSLKKGWTAGPIIIVGHGILEFILIIFMTFGLKDFFAKPAVAGLIGLFGGAFLAWMGFGMLKSGINKSVSLENPEAGGRAGTRNLALAGVIVSATNPYFILWWATTGMESVRRSYTLGLLGVCIFFCGHILADFVWYTAVTTAFSRGRKIITDAVYHWIIILLGVFLLAFSLYFLLNGWQMLH
ncbi:MAG TPA: LysE family transporter [Firmicutes bacterium]|nr:LysE family transporter [Bacillota bacterium]